MWKRLRMAQNTFCGDGDSPPTCPWKSLRRPFCDLYYRSLAWPGAIFTAASGGRFQRVCGEVGVDSPAPYNHIAAL